ncbi:oxygen-independent coproporphyrinogen III oxidase [Xanthobacter autotrophicus]|uniref:oxygen-independent coproporphyrinogen III oxidase n=1 Tax=Xanthobacter TaxID=279 RepID=UPI0024ABF540|nr:oxygen-independent coproporphyrinogen III oxidase [Xanthobacter autotrophicus]MDI4664464.1 oxygen-independent coproporphyrinogen III oxidase [Xanthobacter autotrophicus]
MTQAAFCPAPRLDAPTLLARYGQPVPRYTSYPTAPHFSPAVDAATYASWLAEVPGDARVSAYVHVPFCAELCLYCGCQTAVARSRTPVKAYAERLVAEIGLVARHLPGRLKLSHLHFGGGTPTMLADEDFASILGALRETFDFAPDAEIAIEIDPRVMDADKVETLAREGFNRASLGVQDFDPAVQQAIGRHQSCEETQAVADALRAAGIAALNLDLMYGLPHQDKASVRRTVEAALGLDPDRIAVFGYAHVPWMKKHQALIPEDALPGAAERLAQAELVADMLAAHGYVPVGLDHFARASDAMAERAAAGTLKRNFQGYTTDDAPVLIGFGASAIGALPQGYVQNLPATPTWHKAVEAGTLPIGRGVALSDEDRLRRHVIERLMCDLAVDLDAACAQYGFPRGFFADEIHALEPLIVDGLAFRHGAVVEVPEAARPFTRVVCAVFDARLAASRAAAPEQKRHAAVV